MILYKRTQRKTHENQRIKTKWKSSRQILVHISVGNACECIFLNCVCVVCVTVCILILHRFTNIFQGDLVNGIRRDSWCWSRNIKALNLSTYLGLGSAQFNMMTKCSISGWTAVMAENTLFCFFLSSFILIEFRRVRRSVTTNNNQFCIICLCSLISNDKTYAKLYFRINQAWNVTEKVHYYLKDNWILLLRFGFFIIFWCYYLNDYLMAFRTSKRKA